MKKYNLNKYLWGVCLTLLVFAFTGCDDDNEFSDLNPDIRWNIDKNEVLRLEDYTGILGADAQFYDVDDNLIKIAYDKNTNSHIIIPKTLGGNNFRIIANDNVYNVRLIVCNYVTIRSWGVQSIRKGIECSYGLRTKIEEELDKRNYFIFNNSIELRFKCYPSPKNPAPKYCLIFSHDDENFNRIEVECDSKYDIETKEFTITERSNPKHSQVITFHTTYAQPYFTSDFTNEMQQKYGKDKVAKACLYYDVYCTNTPYIKE